MSGCSEWRDGDKNVSKRDGKLDQIDCRISAFEASLVEQYSVQEKTNPNERQIGQAILPWSVMMR